MNSRNTAASHSERINRYLSRSGVGSRRRADDLITQGRVTLNGAVVEKPGVLVDPDVDRVELDGKPMVPAGDDPVWIVFNKPREVLTTRRDVRGRPVVFDHLPKEFSGLIPVGRLDFDTEGILLLTSDGDAANRLMHPRYQIERVYEALVRGKIDPFKLRPLSAGIDLGDPTPARAEAEILRHLTDTTVVRISIREGRKREIKRMMEAIGHRVLRLRRVAYGPIRTGRLGVGHWRNLSMHELKKINQAIAQSEAADPD